MVTIEKTLKVDVEITSEDMAKAFTAMSSHEQCLFFIKVAEEFDKWESGDSVKAQLSFIAAGLKGAHRSNEAILLINTLAELVRVY
jgi:hypothetical protein